ncbi:NUDIX hydrolase [Candidatus Leptofilum sp.]|uniref:NUDIX hydrolase n=1 Tax=Candidatus Leptofilum sp. TaxID=3241576 RepID=UPI003B5A0EE1
MRMTASSIVTNSAGELLMIQRHDIRTFDVPGGGLDLGELPTEAAVRETFEETGLRVRPSQLLGIYHWPNEPNAYLSFYFRCELVGGTIRPSEESPTVAFFAPDKLPRPILPMHQQRIQHSLNHRSHQPLILTQPMTIIQKAGKKVLGRILFPIQRWQRRRSGQPLWPEPPSWRMGAFTIIRNAAGAALWIKRTDRDLWNLPGGGAENEEPPWETAMRETLEETGCQVKLFDLTSINSYTNEANLVFNYTAEIVSGQLTPGPEAADFAWFQPGEEPPNSLPQHRERVADACAASPNVIFRKQDGRIR